MMGKKQSVDVYQRYSPGDEDWIEQVDNTPVEVPTRLKLPQRQIDRVREVIRRELSAQAQESGYESFDEADDFEIEGEDPVSPYELQFEPKGVESPEPRVAADEKGKDDGKRATVGGSGKKGDSVGVGPGDKGAGAAGGKASKSAGSSGGAGSAGEGDEGDKG